MTQETFDTLRGAKMAGKRRGWQHTGTTRDQETGKYSIYHMDSDWVRREVEKGQKMNTTQTAPPTQRREPCAWCDGTIYMSEAPAPRPGCCDAHWNGYKAYHSAIAVQALRALVAADNCNYDSDTMRGEGLFDSARAALIGLDGGKNEIAPAVPEADLSAYCEPEAAQAIINALVESLSYAMPLIEESPGANESYRAAAERKAKAALALAQSFPATDEQK